MGAPNNGNNNPWGAIPVYTVGGSVPTFAGGGIVALGLEYVTGLSGAKGLTVPAGATAASIQVMGQPVQYRDDGVHPTAVAGGGIMLLPTQTIPYNVALDDIEFIETVSGAYLVVLYYGPATT